MSTTDILHEHDDFLIVAKPAGVSVQGDRDGEGLVDLLHRRGHEDCIPVHRLDKVTSGLVVFARSPGAARDLSECFQKREVDKYYLAISDRKPRKKRGTVRGRMVRTRRGAWRFAKRDGKQAITQFFTTSIRPKLRLFIIRPLTGRTHQIRVALKSIGAAILGDPVYYPGASRIAIDPNDPPVAEGMSIPEKTDREIDRTYLHAYCLSFRYRDEPFRFTVPPDGGWFDSADFLAAFESYREPWELDWPLIRT